MPKIKICCINLVIPYHFLENNQKYPKKLLILPALQASLITTRPLKNLNFEEKYILVTGEG